MALESGTKLGTYEISDLLGKGGMGEVYRARDTKLGREVAIKVLPAEFARDAERLARLEREARMLAALNHPNIAAIHGLEESDDTRFLVLELVEGDTLADRLKGGAIPVEESLKLALQIAEALEAAHEKGVIHRDLKPANIKITPEGRVKVLDFGLAKAFIGDQADVNLSNSPTLSMAATQQGVVLGTAAYMSPEQAGGEVADHRTDVWSFGVVLFEMLAGRQLFTGKNVTHILADVVKSDPHWDGLPGDLHPRIRLLLEGCLDKEPKDRLSAISDARVSIQKVLADPQGVTIQPAPEDVQSASQSKLSWGAVIAFAVVIAGVAGWFLRPEPAPEPGPVSRWEHEVAEGFGGRGILSTLDVSPDGRHFVYHGAEGFYIRSLDQFATRLVEGTEGELFVPEISPDGDWIAFWNNDTGTGQLEKITISGGSRVPIGTPPNTGAALLLSWGADDNILFTMAGSGSIYSVSANGGTPEPIFEAEEGQGLVGPQLLPDGRGVLFSVVEDLAPGPEVMDTGRIVVQVPGSPERREVWTGSNPRYVPSGHLLYTLGDTLYGIAFDLDTLATSGTAVPLERGLFRGTFSGTGNYALSGDGTLVYRTGGGAAGGFSTTNLFVWVDRDGNEEDLGLPPGAYQFPRLSADAARLTFHQNPQGSAPDVWLSDLGRTPPTRDLVTTAESMDNFGVWLDEERIVFASRRNGSPAFFSKRADGTGEAEHLIDVETSGFFIPYDLSPDGETLVFGYEENEGDIGLLSLGDTVEWSPLFNTPASELTPAISPDGEWIAYTTDQTGLPQVVVERFPEGGDREPISTDGGEFPLWSQDGAELFFRRLDGATMVVPVETDPTFRLSGDPQVLIEQAYASGRFVAAVNYDYDSVSQRFLMLKAEPVSDGMSGETEEGPATPRIRVIQNFVEELKERVPVP